MDNKKTLEQAIEAAANLWDPATFPTSFESNEYLRGQIETIVDLFPLPEQYRDDYAKPYVYSLMKKALGLHVIEISEDMYATWEMIVNLHQGANTVHSEYTLGQLELFVVEARTLFGEDITANDIPALRERLAQEIK